MAARTICHGGDKHHASLIYFRLRKDTDRVVQTIYHTAIRRPQTFYAHHGTSAARRKCVSLLSQQFQSLFF
jgi:hypothetical protein